MKNGLLKTVLYILYLQSERDSIKLVNLPEKNPFPGRRKKSSPPEFSDREDENTNRLTFCALE
jgi:hypothetical protein